MTGKFKIRSVRAKMLTSTHIGALVGVEVCCCACERASALHIDNGLINVQGAGVLICPGCGNRQGVSRKRFEEALAFQQRALRDEQS